MFTLNLILAVVVQVLLDNAFLLRNVTFVPVVYRGNNTWVRVRVRMN